MSETTAQPADQPADAATEPVDTPATPAPTSPPEEAEAARSARDERRWATLSAKLAAGDAERARMAAEMDDLRRRAPPPEPEVQLTPEQEAWVEQRVSERLAAGRTQERVQGFHAAGRAEYSDWGDRCASLMSMGADAQIAELLVDTPNGARVAAALADAPDDLRRIAAASTLNGRAIALGRFVAGLENTASEAPGVPRNVSRAPPPPRTVGNGSVRPTADPTTMSPQQLVEMYSREAMAKRGL